MTDATVLVKELWVMRICYRGGLYENWLGIKENLSPTGSSSLRAFVLVFLAENKPIHP